MISLFTEHQNDRTGPVPVQRLEYRLSQLLSTTAQLESGISSASPPVAGILFDDMDIR